MPDGNLDLLVEPLRDDHVLSGFTCEDSAQVAWLQRAHRERQTNMSSTYVMVRDGGLEVLGFFAFCMTAIEAVNLPGRWRIGTRANPRREPVPALLLGQLARHRDLRGVRINDPRSARVYKIGDFLLLAAIDVAYEAIKIAAAPFLVVDASSDAAVALYERSGFKLARIPDNCDAPRYPRYVLKL